MNLLLFKQDALQGNIVTIDDQEKTKHVIEVLKLKKGDSIKLGQLNGLSGTGTILEINEKQLLIEASLTENPPPPLPCTVVLALPRPQQFKRILLHLSSMGIKHLHLIQSERVEKNYWQSPKLLDMESYLIEGLEQARDSILPDVHQHKKFSTFMETTLPILVSGKQAWIAHPDSESRINKDKNREQLIVIGPEGGFTDNEVERFENAGCKRITLGERLLKTETAIPYMLGALFGI